MHSGKYVFAQVLKFINRYEFEKCVTRYHGDYRTRELSCWDQFIQLFFGQLTARRGLRDICLCLKAHEKKLYHLGIRRHVNQSTLTRANEHREWRIFADFGAYLIALVQPLYAGKTISDIASDNDLFALDSTTVSVSLKLWKWAPGKYERGAVKVHALLDIRGNIPTFILITDGRYHDSRSLDEIAVQPHAIYVMDKAYVDFRRLYQIHTQEAFFVTRAKKGLSFKVVTSHPVDKSTGLLCDQTIVLSVWKSRKSYPERLRRVKYYDKDKENTIIFLTNNMTACAFEIVQLYKNRWGIEVFFKLIKQNLQIKTLWGHSENAVNIHIWIAICTYLMIAYLKFQIKSHLSIHEIMQILEISCFDKTTITELLTKSQINQNVNEQLNLFNIT
jgi:hypothetical protein